MSAVWEGMSRHELLTRSPFPPEVHRVAPVVTFPQSGIRGANPMHAAILRCPHLLGAPLAEGWSPRDLGPPSLTFCICKMKDRIITSRVPLTWSHRSQPGTATLPVAVPVGRPPPPDSVSSLWGSCLWRSRLGPSSCAGLRASAQARLRPDGRGGDRRRGAGRGALCDGDGPDAALKMRQLTFRNEKRCVSESSVKRATHTDVSCESLSCLGEDFWWQQGRAERGLGWPGASGAAGLNGEGGQGGRRTGHRQNQGGACATQRALPRRVCRARSVI